MDPVVSVAAALLRQQMPDVTLRPGSTVMARVASRGEHHGVIVLAGVPLTAQLPDDVHAGATLRLRVREVSQERVVLQLDPTLVNPDAVSAPPQARPQGRVHVGEPPRRKPAGEEAGAGVSLAFTSPALGRLDLRIDLASGRLDVGVTAAAGRPYELADEGAERLRASLEQATGLPSGVRVLPRREPLDVYA